MKGIKKRISNSVTRLKPNR
ncbi:hypothetical protein BsWGS_19149 [Bradybaena similaris]